MRTGREGPLQHLVDVHDCGRVVWSIAGVYRLGERPSAAQKERGVWWCCGAETVFVKAAVLGVVGESGRDFEAKVGLRRQGQNT